MPRINMVQITMRANAETKNDFIDLFEASGANSHGEFQQKMQDAYRKSLEQDFLPSQSSQIVEVEKVVEVEKQLEENQILLTLNPLQFFALRHAVLSSPDFAEQQNNIIDSLRKGKPWYYSGNLYDPEFSNAFVRNVSLSKVEPELKEPVIHHNMSAFLVNLFMMNVIEENLSTIRIKSDHLKAFVRKQIEAKKAEETIKSSEELEHANN